MSYPLLPLVAKILSLLIVRAAFLFFLTNDCVRSLSSFRDVYFQGAFLTSSRSNSFFPPDRGYAFPVRKVILSLYS